MKIRNFLLVTLLALAGGLTISGAIAWQNHSDAEQIASAETCEPGRRSAAVWKEVYKTPDQLIANVDTIVVAEALSTAPSRVAYSENSKDEIPFELVTFRVTNAVKGAEEGELIYVERAGGITSDGQQVQLDIDGGDFKDNASYFLFLKRQENGPYFYQVNDQGRYNIANGKLESVVEDNDPVKIFFDGKMVEEGLRSAVHNENRSPKENKKIK